MQKQNGKIIFSKFLKDKKKRKVIPIKILLNKTNILMIHGENDPIVPPNNLLEAKDFFLRKKCENT